MIKQYSKSSNSLWLELFPVFGNKEKYIAITLLKNNYVFSISTFIHRYIKLRKVEFMYNIDYFAS